MQETINLFVGFDPREEIGTHSFNASVLAHTTIPVAITHLHKHMLEKYLGQVFETGSNDFTKTRFLIPHLMGHKGWAIFADGADMVCMDDLAELISLANPLDGKAVYVVKHDYKTNSARKYIGTQMEADNQDYPRKNWASLMLINCSHFGWPGPKEIAQMKMSDLLQFKFLEDGLIGELPIEWNWIVDEYGSNDEAKLIHWTKGIPAFKEYSDAPMAEKWFVAHTKANYATN
jgi:hypothetical protein